MAGGGRRAQPVQEHCVAWPGGPHTSCTGVAKCGALTVGRRQADVAGCDAVRATSHAHSLVLAWKHLDVALLTTVFLQIL
jgi:hypothetical protein